MSDLKFDKDKIEKAKENAHEAAIIARSIYAKADEIKLPSHIKFIEVKALNMTGINSCIGDLTKNISALEEKLEKLIDGYLKLESGVSEGADNLGQNFKLGDTIQLTEGIKFWETGRAEGRNGVINNDSIRPEGDYVVNRAAFYLKGSNTLIKNIAVNEGENDIEKIREDLAKQYGVATSEIDISLCVSMAEGGDAGWLDNSQITYDQINGNYKKNNTPTEEKEDLEKIFDKIDEKYNGTEFCGPDAHYNEIKGGRYEEAETVSFWATVGESSINAVGGFYRPIAGIVDIIPGVKLNGLINEWEKTGAEFFGELGSAGVDKDYKMWQEAAGAALFLALTAKGVKGTRTNLSKNKFNFTESAIKEYFNGSCPNKKFAKYMYDLYTYHPEDFEYLANLAASLP